MASNPLNSAEPSAPPLAPPRPHSAVAQPVSRHDLFHGQGEVRVWSLLHPQALDPFRAVLWCELEARGCVGAHVQQHYPETILCLAGEGVVLVGERVYPFQPGVCVPLRHGEVLQIENLIDAPLSYLITKAEPAST